MINDRIFEANTAVNEPKYEANTAVVNEARVNRAIINEVSRPCEILILKIQKCLYG